MRRMILLAFTLSVAGLASHAAELVDGGPSYGNEQFVPANGGMSFADEDAPDEDLVEQDPIRSYVPQVRHHYRRHHARVGGRSASSKRSPLLAAACDRFVTPSDTLGDYGQLVKSAIEKSKYRAKFLAGSGIQRYCPRYKSSWPDEMKYKAWAAFWESLGSAESGCGTNPLTYAPYKKEIGIWQLERFHNRNRFRAPICQHIHTVADEAACAVSIMGDIQFKHNRPVQSSQSYWGPIRWLSQSVLIPRMRRFAFCN